MKDVKTLGIDLSKHVFQLHGVDGLGNPLLKKKLSREKLPEFMSTLPCCEVVMEACGGANFWARAFQQAGHQVKLISPQWVKPFVKGNKNDANDSEAIVEANSRPTMRYVAPKTVEQQDMQSLLRLRESCIKGRVQISNQLRGLLTEYGIIIPKGDTHLRKAIPSLCDRTQENGLSALFKELLETQFELFKKLAEQISFYDKKAALLAKGNEACQKVLAIEGVGTLSAIALVVAVGQAKEFKNGRHFSAFLGLVPRQHSSGSRNRLLGISKRGDGYLRELLIHGARSVLLRSGNKTDPRSQWINKLLERRGYNCTATALANKNARIALAVLKSGEAYKKTYKN
jgi:transposase